MERIGAVLAGLIENLGIKTRLERQEMVVLWEEVVGNKISSNARAVDCRGSSLVVEVNNSTWLQELSLMRQELIDRLNQAAGKRVLEGITFYLEKK